jgi:hypothetical protein
MKSPKPATDTIYPHIEFDDIGQCWIFTPHFYAEFWQTFWKRRIAPLLVIYHYVKFYVSIIIQLEVININVQHFKFPIGFYSTPTLFEPPKIWLWPPLPQIWKL